MRDVGFGIRAEPSARIESSVKRYVIGALCGALAFGVTYGLLIVGFEAMRGRAIRVRSLADVVLALSAINMVILLSIQGPVLLAIRRCSTGVVRPAPAALITVCLAAIGFFAAWLMFRESNETIAGLLSYIRNVPGEFTLNLIPHTVSAGLFAAWILSTAVPRLNAQSPKPRA